MPFCCANQLTGFYMRATPALNGLMSLTRFIFLIDFCYFQPLLRVVLQKKYRTWEFSKIFTKFWCIARYTHISGKFANNSYFFVYAFMFMFFLVFLFLLFFLLVLIYGHIKMMFIQVMFNLWFISFFWECLTTWRGVLASLCEIAWINF